MRLLSRAKNDTVSLIHSFTLLPLGEAYGPSVGRLPVTVD